MKVTNYGGPEKTILKYKDHIAVGVRLNKTAFATIANANEGVVPAGTIIHFNLEDRNAQAEPSTAEKAAAGVLLHDTDINGKEANAATAVIHGFIDLNAIPTAPTAAQKTALNLIKFLK